MSTNIQEDFKICISVPLRPKLRHLYNLFVSAGMLMFGIISLTVVNTGMKYLLYLSLSANASC